MYEFKIKKGDIEVELKSDDINFFEQQMNKLKSDLLNIKSENIQEQTSETPNNIISETAENVPEPEQSENSEQMTSEPQAEQPENYEQEIARESQRILEEYKAELQQDEIQKEEFNQEIKEIIDETKDSDEQNQSDETTGEIEHNENDFDALLQESMSQCINNIQQNRDENFIRLINEKNITEKIDFLITTAYYLEKNQNYEKYTLSQINKKLTENSFESVEFSVMQDAVDNGFAEIVQTEQPGETEYRLTEVYKNFVAERAQNA